MPPKKEEKKQIIAIFQPSPYWKYVQYPQEVLDKVDHFLNNFQNELKALIEPDKHLNLNYQTLAKKIGCDIHPCLAYQQKKQSQFPSLKSTDYGQKYIVFLNHKIDAITLKMLTFLTTHYKINTIKFSSNDLNHQANEVKKLIEKQDSLTSLYFEWNPLKGIQNRNQLFSSLYLPSLQHLILRDCQMGDQIAVSLLNKILANPASNLVSLDLYGNKLTPEIDHQINKFVEQSKKLQFLGLSKNELNTYSFVKNLFNSIGQIPLTEEEYQQYKAKQKERDDVVERNKKRKKGAPEEAVPFLLQIKQNEKGRFYVKNQSLKVVNLSGNGIKDGGSKQSMVQLIKGFVQNQGKNVQLFIEGNLFSKKSKEMFKFYQNIYF